MAGKVDFEVSANPEKAIADLSKVINKQDAVIGKLKQSNREAKKSQKAFGDMGSGLGSMVKDAGAMAAGFASVNGAVALMRTGIQLAKAEFEDMVRKQNDAARGSMSFAQGATSAITNFVGSTGLDVNVGRMKTTIQGVPSVGLKEGIGLFSAYANARPAGSMDQNLEVLGMSGSGGTPEDRKRTVGLVGQIQNLIPEKSADDAYDIATALIRDSGQMSDQLPAAMKGLFAMKRIGADPEKLLGRLTHIVQAKQKPRIFSGMAGAIGTVQNYKTTMRRPGSGPLDPSAMAKNELVGKSPDEILAWLDANSDRAGVAMGSTWPTIAAGFGPGVGSRGLAALQGYQSGNLYDSEIANRGKSSYFSMMKVGQENAAMIEDMQVDNTAAAQAGQVRKMMRESLESMPRGGAFGRKWAMRRLEADGFFGDDYGGAAQGLISDMRGGYGPTITRPLSIGIGGTPGVETVDNPRYDPKMIETLDRLGAQIERMSAAFEMIDSGSLNPVGGLD